MPKGSPRKGLKQSEGGTERHEMKLERKARVSWQGMVDKIEIKVKGEMLKNFKDVKNLGMQNDHTTILKYYSDCYTMKAIHRLRMLMGE